MEEGSHDAPLMKFAKDMQPGWRPGLKTSPLRQWTKRLQLWHKVTNMPAHAIGPAVAARLEGRPVDIAAEVTRKDHNGAPLYGDEALSYKGDPNTGTPSGFSVLLEKLQQLYGAADQTIQVSAMDMFENFRRSPGQSLQGFSD